MSEHEAALARMAEQDAIIADQAAEIASLKADRDRYKGERDECRRLSAQFRTSLAERSNDPMTDGVPI